MRNPNRGGTFVGLALAIVLVTACGGAVVPSTGPSTPPGPVVTPNPHLTAPASVDDVMRFLTSGGLRITPNTASSGSEPIKKINATYANWPLVLTQFSTAEALRGVGKFDPSKAPVRGDAPYAIAGLNILVEFGPHSTNDRTPAPPSPAQREAAVALVALLDPLVGPLAQRSTEPLPLPNATAQPAPGASGGSPSSSPTP